MYNSVQPHRQQPTRLPHPWDSPGKNTEVGCHFLLQCMKVKSPSRARLLATPWTTAYQAPPSMGISRQEYWSGVPLPSLIYGLFVPFICVFQILHTLFRCLFIYLSLVQWHPTPVLLPGKSHGWRSLVGYNPWGHEE